MLAQIMVGINIVSSKFLLSSFSTIFLLAMRFGLATLILFALHLLDSSNKKTVRLYFAELNRKDWFFLFAQAVSAGILFNCLMLIGLRHTDANVAGIITSALPAIITLFCCVFLGERFSRKTALSIFFATIGLVVIGGAKLSEITSSHSFFGDSIVLLSLIPEAAYYVLCKLHPNRLPLFLTSALLNGINAIILGCMLPFVHLTEMSIHLSDWVILFILGLSSGFFYVFWFLGCQRVDGIMTSLSTAIMPVATVLLAMMALGEHLTAMEGAGMGLVMISILIHAKG